MPSMAFAQSTQARLPHVPANRRSLDDAADFAHAADRPVAPPRFDPGLSTGPGSFATGDPGVSPDRTLTGWLSRACARLCHVRSLRHGVRATGRTRIQAQSSLGWASSTRSTNPPSFVSM